jgi:hypothetical protein
MPTTRRKANRPRRSRPAPSSWPMLVAGW